MFPLVDRDAPNPTELFQIWLNLPASQKMVDPYFTMLWAHQIPVHRIPDESGRITEVLGWQQSTGATMLPVSTSQPALDQIRHLLGVGVSR